MSVHDIPEEILAKIIHEARSNETPSGIRVLATPKDEIATLEGAQHVVLSCRLVSKKFNRVATKFSCPQFLELLPQLLAATSVKPNKDDLNSTTIGHCSSALSSLLWLKRLRHLMPYIIPKIFTKPEDRAKAKSLFDGMTYLSANPEVFATFRVPNDTQNIVVLESFRFLTSFVKFFGGVVQLKEGETDILSVSPKRLRTLFGADAERFMGDLVRPDLNLKTKYRLHGNGINKLATGLGCPEWKLAEQEKEFLLPRFLLAINGFPILAMQLKADNFYVINESVNPVEGSPFVANKIPLKEHEVPPVIERKKNQYKLVEVYQKLQQSIIDLKPTFHSSEEVLRYYSLLKNFVDAKLLGTFFLANILFGSDSDYHYAKHKHMRKHLKNIIPIMEFTRLRSTFVEGPETRPIDFIVARINDYSFKLVFSDSLQLKVDVERFTSMTHHELVCVYISGIGWKPLDKALKENKADRLLISYCGPFKPEHGAYPQYNFKYPEVIKIIDVVINQYVVANDFSLEWLLNKLFFEIEDDLRIYDQICSPYSLEMSYISKPIKVPGDADSGSGSDSDEGEEEFSSEDSEYGGEYRSDDGSSDSYSENERQQKGKYDSDSDSDDDSDEDSDDD